MIKIIILLMSFNLLACPNNVIKVKKGDTSPCDAWIVSEPMMQEFSKSDRELSIVKKENLTLKELAKVNEEISEAHKKQTKDLQTQLNWEQTKSNFKSVGFFILGVAATSLAAYAAIKSSR